MNKAKILMTFLLMFMFIGCDDGYTKQHENQKTKKVIKKGKIVDIDYVGSYYRVQLKFEDGHIFLCWVFNRDSRKDIRIGQTGTLYKNTVTHEDVWCSCCEISWEIEDHTPIREMDVEVRE